MTIGESANESDKDMKAPFHNFDDENLQCCSLSQQKKWQNHADLWGRLH